MLLWIPVWQLRLQLPSNFFDGREIVRCVISRKPTGLKNDYEKQYKYIYFETDLVMNPISVYRVDEDISNVSPGMISFDMGEAKEFTFEFSFLTYIMSSQRRIWIAGLRCPSIEGERNLSWEILYIPDQPDKLKSYESEVFTFNTVEILSWMTFARESIS